MSSVFETLNNINVNDKVEKKNGLSYLPWSFAWGIAKKYYPNATRKIYERDSDYGPINYFTDGRTCWVKTSVTIEGIEYIDMLPVMDYKNKSIPYEKVTSFDVNKAIQRSLTKALSYHGLGLYLYAGDDLPEEEKSQAIQQNQEDRMKKYDIVKALYKEHENFQPIMKSYMNSKGLKNLKQLTSNQFQEIIDMYEGGKEQWS